MGSSRVIALDNIGHGEGDSAYDSQQKPIKSGMQIVALEQRQLIFMHLSVFLFFRLKKRVLIYDTLYASRDSLCV